MNHLAVSGRGILMENYSFFAASVREFIPSPPTDVLNHNKFPGMILLLRLRQMRAQAINYNKLQKSFFNRLLQNEMH